MWNQWRRWDDFVALRVKKFQKRTSYIIGCNHGFDLGDACPHYNPVNGLMGKIFDIEK